MTPRDVIAMAMAAVSVAALAFPATPRSLAWAALLLGLLGVFVAALDVWMPLTRKDGQS